VTRLTSPRLARASVLAGRSGAPAPANGPRNRVVGTEVSSGSGGIYGSRAAYHIDQPCTDRHSLIVIPEDPLSIGRSAGLTARSRPETTTSGACRCSTASAPAPGRLGALSGVSSPIRNRRPTGRDRVWRGRLTPAERTADPAAVGGRPGRRHRQRSGHLRRGRARAAGTGPQLPVRRCAGPPVRARARQRPTTLPPTVPSPAPVLAASSVPVSPRRGWTPRGCAGQKNPQPVPGGRARRATGRRARRRRSPGCRS